MNKDFIKWLSQPAQMSFIGAAKDSAERERRKLELKKRFDAQFSSATANFSNPAVEDIGNESGIYDDCTDFASFNKKAREETAFQAIRRIVAVSNVRESVKTYLTQRNDVIRRNKAKAKEKEKQAKNKHVSHPNWF